LDEQVSRNSAKIPEISVVIPVYNSRDCVQELVSRLDDSLKGISHQIILVNDHSPDNSWAKIVAAAEKNKRVVGVNLRKNAGQDNAIMAGLSFAKGSYAVIMDDDLQHSPADILKLYDKVKQGYDVCYAHFIEKKHALWKNIGSWLNGKIAEIVISKPPHIYLSPFKIVRNDIVQEILTYRGIFPYIDGMIFQVTNNVSEVTVEHNERFIGKGNYNLIRSIIVFMKLVTGFSVQPLRITAYIGFIVAVLGFLFGLFHLGNYLLGEKYIEGWTSIIVLLMFMSGLVLMSLGLIGEYVGRMYMSMNFKPQYVIREVMNADSSADKKRRTK
jgi:polyisoprenyl-phosphate glycosyltransferase